MRQTARHNRIILAQGVGAKHGLNCIAMSVQRGNATPHLGNGGKHERRNAKGKARRIAPIARKLGL